MAERRGNIACVASNLGYNLLDVENIQRIPLFSIASPQEPEPEPSAAPVEEPQVQPSESDQLEAPIAASDSPTSFPTPHPPRSSSLVTGRERRNSSAATIRETSIASGHSRIGQRREPLTLNNS
jgi:hypothetical protein